ncbi:MAG TPA: hemin uptake protein HemP [Rudaea sp.]|jgi:hemin uptake protein HemP|nr:hemin uptake protein HemP [Rudaea sp.]
MLDARSSTMTPRHNAVHNTPAPLAPKQMTSNALFGGTQEVRIDHHGQEYRLRQTRNGKLILTK